MNNPKIKVKSKKFMYRRSIKFFGKWECIIKSKDKPAIGLSAPVEFGGKKGVWTPEDLIS